MLVIYLNEQLPSETPDEQDNNCIYMFVKHQTCIESTSFGGMLMDSNITVVMVTFERKSGNHITNFSI